MPVHDGYGSQGRQPARAGRAGPHRRGGGLRGVMARIVTALRRARRGTGRPDSDSKDMARSRPARKWPGCQTARVSFAFNAGDLLGPPPPALLRPPELTATEQQRAGRLRRWQRKRGYAATRPPAAADHRYSDADRPAGLIGWYHGVFQTTYGEADAGEMATIRSSHVRPNGLTGTAGKPPGLYKKPPRTGPPDPLREVQTALAIFHGDSTSAS